MSGPLSRFQRRSFIHPRYLALHLQGMRVGERVRLRSGATVTVYQPRQFHVHLPGRYLPITFAIGKGTALEAAEHVFAHAERRGLALY